MRLATLPITVGRQASASTPTDYCDEMLMGPAGLLGTMPVL